MSGPDLPQPIYPTPGPGQPPSAGEPAGAGPVGPPTYSVGPPPGGGPQGPKSNQTALFAAIGVAVVVLIGVAILVATSGGGDDPPSTAAPTTDGASGGGTEPGPGASTGPEGPGGGEDLDARAESVAALTLATDLPSTEACLAEGLVNDPELLALIEPTIATGVTLNSPDDAARYADAVMTCASPLDLTQESVQSVESQYDPVTLACIEGGLSSLSAEEWALFIEWGVQPSRAGEAEGLIAEATGYC